MTGSLPSVVDTSQLQELRESGSRARLVDVRSPGEFESVHITGSYNVPLDVLTEHKASLRTDHQDPVVLVCASGVRASDARTVLANAGVGQLSVLDGGVNQWEKEGAPVTRGEGRWAMERQVRLVAGSLVLTGILGSTVFRPLKWIAGFIGAGLTFSAISNTCGMAYLLSKLPYNRTPDADARTLLSALTADVPPSAR